MTDWDRMYRDNWGAVVSRLAGQFGPAQLGPIESATQDAFVRAIETWQSSGVPDSPRAWLVSAARNRLLDGLRSKRTHRDKEAELTRHLDAQAPIPQEAKLESEMQDEQLHMLFVCCHPSLADDVRVPLTLKSLCGFDLPALARTFLVSQDALKKRLVRARAVLKEKDISFDLPSEAELQGRLDSVLKVLYLIFNEGYSGHTGEEQIRAELCEEAMRLTLELSRHPAAAVPRTWALLAMFMLVGARIPARLDTEGALVDLRSQDRSQWNSAQIRTGIEFLRRSAVGEELSGYHLEAMIAGCHARAASHQATDWAQIAQLYDQLHDLVPSPVILLQAAIARGYDQGPEVALAAIHSLGSNKFMKRFYLYYAALGEFAALSGDSDAAVAALEKALALTSMPAERAALRRKIERLS